MLLLLQRITFCRHEGRSGWTMLLLFLSGSLDFTSFVPSPLPGDPVAGGLDGALSEPSTGLGSNTTFMNSACVSPFQAFRNLESS